MWNGCRCAVDFWRHAIHSVLTRVVFCSSRSSSPRRAVPAKQQSRSSAQQALQSGRQVQSTPDRFLA